MFPDTYDSTTKLLGVLARLPAQVIRVQSERELREAVGPSIAELFGPVRRFDLFVADGASGSGLVPAGEPREGLSLLGVTMGAAPDAVTARPQLVAGAQSRGDILSVPVSDRTGAMGVLVVEAVPGGSRFDQSDLDALAAVAAQITLALQRLRIERKGAAARRLERDMVLAREVQRRFLPALPSGGRLRLHAHYRPAYDVGGDFYDLVPLSTGPDAPVMAMIGDVAGKGVAAALLMSRVSSDLRRLATELRSPARLLDELNRSMGIEHAETFATAACVLIDPAVGRATVANAGHVPPIVRRASGAVTPFGRASGPPVGVIAGQIYAEEALALAPGDTMFLMTDGLSEALDRPGDRMGMRLLISIIADAPADPGQACARILAAVERERMLRHVDDVTLLAVQLSPE